MYVTYYKLNNSYTTYVIHDDGGYNTSNQYRKSTKPLEWKCGSSVNHMIYGKGVIQSISKNRITVRFNESKIYRNIKYIQITFEFKTRPSEIDSLCLCYR